MRNSDQVPDDTHHLIRDAEYWVPAETDTNKAKLPGLPTGHYLIKIHYEMDGSEYDISFEADYKHGVRWEKFWEMPVC